MLQQTAHLEHPQEQMAKLICAAVSSVEKVRMKRE
jgi:hypothetical protein